MSEFKGKIGARLRSAQHWLRRAEQAFESEKEAQGQLNLLLAQAELQHIQEKSAKSRWSWQRQLLAFSFALFVLSAGAGGTWFYLSRTELPVQTELAETRLPGSVRPERTDLHSDPASAAPSSAPLAKPLVAVKAPAAVPTAALPAVEQRTVSQETTARDTTEKVVEPQEMQQLMRAAGKSLRGQ